MVQLQLPSVRISVLLLPLQRLRGVPQSLLTGRGEPEAGAPGTPAGPPAATDGSAHARPGRGRDRRSLPVRAPGAGLGGSALRGRVVHGVGPGRARGRPNRQTPARPRAAQEEGRFCPERRRLQQVHRTMLLRDDDRHGCPIFSYILLGWRNTIKRTIPLRGGRKRRWRRRLLRLRGPWRN